MISMLLKRAQVRSEGGFTLIELLVVVIIIGILAAIAIPMYLSQRQKGWEATAESDLRNAAVAQESYYVTNDVYADDVALLDPEGFTPSNGVDFTVTSGDASGFCMDAFHTSGGEEYRFDSDVGAPERNASC